MSRPLFHLSGLDSRWGVIARIRWEVFLVWTLTDKRFANQPLPVHSLYLQGEKGLRVGCCVLNRTFCSLIWCNITVLQVSRQSNLPSPKYELNVIAVFVSHKVNRWLYQLPRWVTTVLTELSLRYAYPSTPTIWNLKQSWFQSCVKRNGQSFYLQNLNIHPIT